MKTAELVWHSMKDETPPVDRVLLGCARWTDKSDFDNGEGRLGICIFKLDSEWLDNDPNSSINGLHLVCVGNMWFVDEIEFWTEVKEEIDISRTGS